MNKPNELIKEATFNSNNTRSAKYGYSPQPLQKQENTFKKSLILID